ncbi:unnamed protein product [Pseudo-nitzschia multistriata]|uniref:DNA polymerase kappa n=1 Tax=Pseudo-nitzschia multistriata TaxID=183589 RepID=A0A448ZMW7_9STRA|nr:unnamed protein product [Pseudo-nitzschia multistriata]
MPGGPRGAGRGRRPLLSNPYAAPSRKRPRPAEGASPGPRGRVLPSQEDPSKGTPAPPKKAPPSERDPRCCEVSSMASALVVSASDKAGMEGIDRSRIDAILLRESGNSLFMRQQKKRDEKVDERVERLKQRVEEAPFRLGAGLSLEEEADEEIRACQRSQATRATCVVVDMDMFYMACELLERPDLEDKPACVGRGMILTSNYVARRYGVRSAMAGFLGDKLVEELSEGRERLVHLPSNFGLYQEKSGIVLGVLREYDPFRMRSRSLDEAFLDIGPYLVVFLMHPGFSHEQIRDALRSGGTARGPRTPQQQQQQDQQQQDQQQQQHDWSCPETAMGFLETLSPLACSDAVERVVSRLRAHVREATGGLTCSAGVGRTFAIAKIASDKNKPDGQLVVDPSATQAFVWSLPVRKIPGIGRVTEKLLRGACGIRTGRELYQKRGLVKWLFPPATAGFLLRASVGCSSGSNGGDGNGGEEHQKGIGRERTFRPESDWEGLRARLRDIARKLADDMARKSVVGHTITVKAKLETFEVLSRAESQKRGVYLRTPEELEEASVGLLASIRSAHLGGNARKFSVRLLGIRCSNLLGVSSLRAGGTIERFFSSSSRSPPSVGGSGRGTGTPERETTEDGNHKDETTPSSVQRTPFAHRHRTQQQQDLVTAAARDAAVAPGGCGSDAEKKRKRTERVVCCPLCSRSFPAEDNDALNAHIDTCLNGVHGTSTVRRAIREEESRLRCGPAAGTGASRAKPRRLTDFWKANT